MVSQLEHAKHYGRLANTRTARAADAMLLDVARLHGFCTAFAASAAIICL